MVVFRPDESSSQKAPWGINIMKKNKKSAPRAFGVRLEDCQPAPDNKVERVVVPRPGAAPGTPHSPAPPSPLPVPAERAPDRRSLLQGGGGPRPGVHGHLPRAREQRRGVQPAGAAQQGSHRDQPAGRGEAPPRPRPCAPGVLLGLFSWSLSPSRPRLHAVTIPGVAGPPSGCCLQRERQLGATFVSLHLMAQWWHRPFPAGCGVGTTLLPSSWLW